MDYHGVDFVRYVPGPANGRASRDLFIIFFPFVSVLLSIPEKKKKKKKDDSGQFLKASVISSGINGNVLFNFKANDSPSSSNS